MYEPKPHTRQAVLIQYSAWLTLMHDCFPVREHMPRTAAMEVLSSLPFPYINVLPHGFMPRPSVFSPVRSGIPRTASCRSA